MSGRRPRPGTRRAASNPFASKRLSQGLLLLGGLWERWRPRGDESAIPLYTCTILTTEANDIVAPVHNRMPLLVGEKDLERWLSFEALGPGELDRLLRPAPPEALEAFRVATLVNDAREEDLRSWSPSASRPMGKVPPAPQLF